jgi:curved DNA-binding protein CbpA
VGKTYYQLLDVPSTATVDEIKRNFRREIAKYHPDKVQHLGPEFQEIAAVRAAELTQAYKALSDEALRTDYDQSLASDHDAAAAPTPAPDLQTPASDAEHSPPAGTQPVSGPSSPGSIFSQDRAASSDLIHKATLMRFNQALASEFGTYGESPVPGFQVTCVPKPPFWKLKLPPRVLARFVDYVNALAVTESWTQASRMKKDNQRDLVVFVLGPVVSPVRELAAAISEQMKRPMLAGGRLFLVPVNTRNWDAHVPNDAPAVVKSLLGRLKAP